MKKFTLYTETKGNIRELAQCHFHSFSLVEQTGVWKGQVELSTQIILLTDHVCGQPYTDFLKKVHSLADRIKITNQREAVFVTEEDVLGFLV